MVFLIRYHFERGVLMSSENNITTTKDIYKKLTLICKTFNIDRQKLVDLAFNELFDLILTDPSIFLEKIGIIDNIKRIFHEE